MAHVSGVNVILAAADGDSSPSDMFTLMYML